MIQRKSEKGRRERNRSCERDRARDRMRDRDREGEYKITVKQGSGGWFAKMADVTPTFFIHGQS